MKFKTSGEYQLCLPSKRFYFVGIHFVVVVVVGAVLWYFYEQLNLDYFIFGSDMLADHIPSNLYSLFNINRSVLAMLVVSISC